MTRRAPIAAAALLIAGAVCAVASAHVTITPRSAVQGEVTEFTLRVPSERTGAKTVGIELYFPSGAPVAAVRVKPRKGWTSTVERSGGGGAVSEVAWRARPGAEVPPGQTVEFGLRIGPLPATDRLVLKALQYYSDGTIERWIQEPQPGEDPPERPAPTVELAAPREAAPASSGGSGALVWAAGLGVLCLALGAGALVLWRRRA